MLAGDKSEWELAMQSEISSIEQNKTWELVPLPKEAMLAGDKSQWELAMQSEISSIE